MAQFNLKSGNTTPFKMMGSSPAKDWKGFKTKVKKGWEKGKKIVKKVDTKLQTWADKPSGGSYLPKWMR